MTFSILARDPETGALGGASATGSLCVGGWVLRGDSRAGMTASQGAAPSTMWGEDTLELMRDGMSAADAVAHVTGADSGNEWRQLAALDRRGHVASHTGRQNTEWHGSIEQDELVVVGNLLSSGDVLEALRDAYLAAAGGLSARLLAALAAGEAAGGDVRGLQSAALLIVSDNRPPLTLRIDWAEQPVLALFDLHQRSQTGEYATWLERVPTRRNPSLSLK
ncbi:DUF1028 domain-containing protein [Aestuariivirga sp.]|uniref:DUF1028 domain-containing protein n=1 Tax=Aestuariivirga sp. TaxID=2650926 RepID=UPI0037841A76